MNSVAATFSNAQVWAVIGLLALFMAMFFVFFTTQLEKRFASIESRFVAIEKRLDKIENNDLPHIYAALYIINDNIKSIGIALKNHPATRDMEFIFKEIPADIHA
jgi:hypothetical protein